MKKILFLISQTLKSYLRAFFVFLFDKRECVVCSAPCGQYYICQDCIKKYFEVLPISEKYCIHCGKYLVSEKRECMECRTELLLHNVDRAFPIFNYRLWNVSLLSLWKIKKQRSISELFAYFLFKRLFNLQNIIGDFVLVPVPPRPKKLQEEGWNQIQDLCDFLQYKYNFKIENLLKRTSYTEQKTLNRKERMRNIGNSYVINTNKTELPQTVCIIDDVMTTGVTIECCARELKLAGVKNVYAITLFNGDAS